MAWFLNEYVCHRCDESWVDEWSCCCDDECPTCGARDISPTDSQDLTTVILKRDAEFAVLWSPETAEHDAEYCELGRFPTRKLAAIFLAASEELDS